MNFAEAQEKRKYRSNFFKKKNGRGGGINLQSKGEVEGKGIGVEKHVLR